MCFSFSNRKFEAVEGGKGLFGVLLTTTWSDIGYLYIKSNYKMNVVNNIPCKTNKRNLNKKKL